MFIGLAWWGVNNINYIKQAQTRKELVYDIKNASAILQRGQIIQLASTIAGDDVAMGELSYLSQDPSQSDAARFNAIALVSELRKGIDEYRWYVKRLAIAKTRIENTAFTKVTFFDGNWDNVDFIDAVFSNVVWSEDKK